MKLHFLHTLRLLLFLACFAFAAAASPTAPCTARPSPTNTTLRNATAPVATRPLHAGAAGAADALITMPPGVHTTAAKFVQTTYTSCVTIGTYSHCGVHEPILDATQNAAGRAVRPGRVVLVVLAAWIAVLGQ